MSPFTLANSDRDQAGVIDPSAGSLEGEPRSRDGEIHGFGVKRAYAHVVTEKKWGPW